MFCASVQRFRECTANNGTTPGQWYELTVRFYARATPQRAHILATSVIPWSSLCAQASNYIVTSKQPSIAGTTSVKAKYEPEEWTLKAVCAYVKGEDSFFEPVPKESVKYALFQVRTVTFAEKTGCGEPIAGQSYMLTLKFATRSAKANHVPVAHVITAKTVGNRLSAVQFRQIETAVADSTSRQSPHVPVGDTTSSIPKQHGRSKYTGVVCYKDRDVCYVYSAQMGYEIPVDSRGRVLDAGDWVEFSVNDEKSIALNPAPAQPRFPTMPSHHSVLVKCSIMVSMDIRETDDTVTSNFVGNVRDIHGLARKVSPGVHSAAIRYVYEEGRDCGQWQLEYVYAKMIS
ncbi:hypothetical protein AAVH_31721 [Aphelenchoides avenae]|nr:hypothetical protein AAVH_31721 [Aphelenchus avenae]